jgi:hypothetical protein
MLQAKSKNRAEALAPFEQQDRAGVRFECPPARAGVLPFGRLAAHFSQAESDSPTRLRASRSGGAPFGTYAYDSGRAEVQPASRMAAIFSRLSA